MGNPKSQGELERQTKKPAIKGPKQKPNHNHDKKWQRFLQYFHVTNIDINMKNFKQFLVEIDEILFEQVYDPGKEQSQASMWAQQDKDWKKLKDLIAQLNEDDPAASWDVRISRDVEEYEHPRDSDQFELVNAGEVVTTGSLDELMRRVYQIGKEQGSFW